MEPDLLAYDIVILLRELRRSGSTLPELAAALGWRLERLASVTRAAGELGVVAQRDDVYVPGARIVHLGEDAPHEVQRLLDRAHALLYATPAADSGEALRNLARQALTLSQGVTIIRVDRAMPPGTTWPPPGTWGAYHPSDLYVAPDVYEAIRAEADRFDREEPR